MAGRVAKAGRYCPWLLYGEFCMRNVGQRAIPRRSRYLPDPRASVLSIPDLQAGGYIVQYVVSKKEGPETQTAICRR